jgi:hypothetical protein
VSGPLDLDDLAIRDRFVSDIGDTVEAVTRQVEAGLGLEP